MGKPKRNILGLSPSGLATRKNRLKKRLLVVPNLPCELATVSSIPLRTSALSPNIEIVSNVDEDPFRTETSTDEPVYPSEGMHEDLELATNMIPPMDEGPSRTEVLEEELFSLCESTDSIDVDEELAQGLRECFISCGTPPTHVTMILKVLHKHHPHLPTDARTLLETPKDLQIRPMGEGRYVHFGLQKELMSRFKNDRTNLVLDFHIDGVEVCNSSNLGFWTIICKSKLIFFCPLHLCPFSFNFFYCTVTFLNKLYISLFFTELKLKTILFTYSFIQNNKESQIP